MKPKEYFLMVNLITYFAIFPICFYLFENYYFSQDFILFDPLLFTINSIILNENSNLFYFPNYLFPEKPKPYDKCKLCSFVPNNGSYPPNSTPRDAIFVLGINKLTNLLPIAKTLRTTGSKSRIFLFTDEPTLNKYNKSSNNFFNALEDCGIEFVNLGTMKSNGLFYICYLKNNIYKSFLIKYKQYFDRVVFLDMYDSIIQHDPFTTEFKDLLYLSDEGYTIKNDKFNFICLVNGFKKLENFTNFVFSPEQKRLIFDGSILNGGLQQGGTSALIKLCHIMEMSGDLKTYEVYSLDQSFLNMIVYSGYLEKHVNFTVLPKGNELSSTVGIYVHSALRNISIPVVFGNISRDGKVPAILHQFDRSGRIKNELRRVCPNDENFSDYLR